MVLLACPEIFRSAMHLHLLCSVRFFLSLKEVGFLNENASLSLSHIVYEKRATSWGTRERAQQNTSASHKMFTPLFTTSTSFRTSTVLSYIRKNSELPANQTPFCAAVCSRSHLLCFESTRRSFLSRVYSTCKQ